MKNEHILDEKLKAQIAENRKLNAQRHELEKKLHLFEGKHGRERRSLLEDNVELQRRLDELTPLLAQKAARIGQLEEEKEQTSARLRNADMQLNSLQVQRLQILFLQIILFDSGKVGGAETRGIVLFGNGRGSTPCGETL